MLPAKTQGLSSNPFPPEAPEGKGPSFASLWSRGDRRGDAEVKQRAAGGARSTRSIGGRCLQLRRRETGPEIYTLNPGSSAARLGAAQWPEVSMRSLLSCLCFLGSRKMQRRAEAAVPVPPLPSPISWERQTSSEARRAESRANFLYCTLRPANTQF